MSYRTYFMFSSGLNAPLHAPGGELERIKAHVEAVERTLGLQLVEREGHVTYWDPKINAELDNETYCRTIREHNDWVQDLYERFAEWSKNPVEGGDTITPEEAKKFWRGLQEIDIPVDRWSEEQYREEMETMYEVLRGRPTRGISFDAKALTVEQAAEVIRLLSFLDPGDQRLDVCLGDDHLTSGDDYTWCERCGAVSWDDLDHRMLTCPSGSDCPLVQEYGDEDDLEEASS